MVHGYVGNKSATFPLQLLGFDVDPLNSVQLSCHTGYKSFKGQILSGDELAAIIAGLKENALLPYSHVLTGYVSSPTFLRTIADVVRAVREVNPAAQYVCDPVRPHSLPLPLDGADAAMSPCSQSPASSHPSIHPSAHPSTRVPSVPGMVPCR